MARIDEYLQKILSARYGEEVRGAIHDSIDEINRVNEANISTVQTIADTAQGYADDAEDSKDLAAQSVTDAQAQVTLAQQQVTLATTQATNSANSAEDSEAWAVGQRGGIDVPSSDETYQKNSKYWQERANYWYQQAQAIAESFSGALRPIGTVTFENLPPLAQADSGDMYNISNQFTTTSDFVEGAGIVVPLGSNVYKTTGGKWDVLAGSPVTGVKGNSESSYRRGNVNITKSNIGLGNVDNTSDANKPVSTAQQTALDAKQNKTDNTLTTTSKTVSGAINELNSDLTAISQNTPDIRIDNTDRKNGQMLFMLLQQIDFSKVNVNTKLEVGTNVFTLCTLDMTNQHLRFTRTDVTSNGKHLIKQRYIDRRIDLW